jgi:hypothetical protein
VKRGDIRSLNWQPLLAVKKEPWQAGNVENDMLTDNWQKNYWNCTNSIVRFRKQLLPFNGDLQRGEYMSLPIRRSQKYVPVARILE